MLIFRGQHEVSASWCLLISNSICYDHHVPSTKWWAKGRNQVEVECYHQFPCQWTFVHWSDWNFKRNLSAKNVLPRKLTWTVKMMVCNGNPLFQKFIFICEMFVWEFRHVTVEVPFANSTNRTWSFHLANQKIFHQMDSVVPYDSMCTLYTILNLTKCKICITDISSNFIKFNIHTHTCNTQPLRKDPGVV